jgi:phosphoglycerate kinase
MKTITDIQNLSGVKVLVRVDFNVPVKSAAVTDDFRIRAAMPTIDFLKSKGARIVLVSHIETADGLASPAAIEKNAKPTLAPVADYLNKKGIKTIFITNWANAFEASERLKDGEIMLLENIRENEGEKKNDPKFAEQLASLADIYVNDAFSVSHREHASVCAVTGFLPSYAGFQLVKEIENLGMAFNPSHPFLFILGGAKFDTKLPLINRFLKTADTIFIGGALANDALKARGCEIGRSKVSSSALDIAPLIDQLKIMLPMDVVIQDHSVKAIGSSDCVESMGKDDAILDAGGATLDALKEKIDAAAFILWNGPLGLFEKGFTQGTEGLALLIAKATVEGANRGVKSIIGGGDTLSAISKLGIEDRFTFVSGGGGAMLDFLAQGTLPGIEALEASKTE